MPTPSKPSRLLLTVLCAPLLLAGCSSDGKTDNASPTASSSATTSMPPGAPTATIYEVTAKAGVSDKDLRDALATISKLPGVIAGAMPGQHKLRIELSAINITANAPAVYVAMAKLGPVKAV